MVPPEKHINLDEETQYAYEFIKDVCQNIGPGCPCTSKELERAERVKKELERYKIPTQIEPFTCTPAAFLKWFQIGGVMAIIATILFYLSLIPVWPIFLTGIALFLMAFTLLMTVLEFLLYQHFIDFLFPKKKSQNVIGRRLPPDNPDPKRVIIFSGHHDSALTFNWLPILKHGYVIAEAILIFSVILFTITLGIRFITLIIGIDIQWITDMNRIITMAVIPITVILAFNFTGTDKNGGKVPGAVDNLSAVGITLTLAKILDTHPELVPPDTEIRFISFGSEEAGVRGSFNYVKDHLEELKSKETYVLNFETIFDEEITIFTSDLNGLLPNSRKMVELVQKAAQESGAPHKVDMFPFGGGGTDAIPFSRYKIPALSLYAMKVPGQMVQFYHQPIDNYDKINQTSLKHALKIALAFLAQFHEKS
jgi:acetylornithine deacetylase/succinyl-diaminopimelate desuccinylase-like protein